MLLCQKAPVLFCSLVAMLLAGCGSSEPQSGVPEANEKLKPKEQVVERVVERTVDVVLTQGTNMALTVNPENGDRVISLQGQLFLLPGDGHDAKPLISPYYDAREPQLGADGSRIVFHGYRNGNWDIWQTDITGVEPTALTTDAFDDREPQFSVDMNTVLFSSDRGGSYDIWSLDLATSELSQLTATEGNAYSPAQNEAGELAYVSSDTGTSTLMVRTADGTKELITHPGRMSGVQWSPDGGRVSYQLLGAEGAQLRLIAAAGGESVVLSAPGADVFPFRAAWLDDQTLSFTANGQVLKQSLIGNPDLGAPDPWPFQVALQLTRHDYQRRQRDYDATRQRRALGLSSPQISNDGAHIYFTALGDVWHWQPTADQLEKVTDTSAAETGLALNAAGDRLAYVSDSGGSLHLDVLDIASGSASTLPVDANSISALSWSPDGTKIGFFVDVPGNPLGGQLTVLDIASGKTTAVLSPMPAQPITWSESGDKVAVTRLNTYSSRYREGVYELVIADWRTSTSTTVQPLPHVSITDAALNPDGSMTYVQAGYLQRLELDSDYSALESAGRVTTELTDMPKWSANGEHLVYMNGQAMKYLNRITGEERDITPKIFWQLEEPGERYVVRAGRVFTGLGESYLVDQDIVVEGSRIVAIGPQDPSVVPDVDASEQTVVPGLFEMHAHMGENSEIQGRTWLSYGVTTVRDPGSQPYLAKERQEAWDSGRRVGPRSHITGYLTDGNRVYYSMAEGIVDDAHLDLALKRAADLELDFIKTYVRLPDHQQKKVVDFAHNIGIPVSSHELYPAVAHGMDHVEHIGGTSRRGYQPKVSRLGYSYQDVIELLSAGGMGMTATAVLPGLAVIVAEEPDWFETPQFDTFYGDEVRRGYELMIKRFGGAAAATTKANGKILRALNERDALLVTGTDSPFSPYGAGLHAEFRLYERAGISPARILHMATMKSAQAAGVVAELGSIETGKLADMVIVDGDPLSDIRDLDQVVMTIKHGQRYPLAELLAVPAS